MHFGICVISYFQIVGQISITISYQFIVHQAWIYLSKNWCTFVIISRFCFRCCRCLFSSFLLFLCGIPFDKLSFFPSQKCTGHILRVLFCCTIFVHFTSHIWSYRTVKRANIASNKAKIAEKWWVLRGLWWIQRLQKNFNFIFQIPLLFCRVK